MITRVTKGDNFRGVLAYAMQSCKGPRLLCTTLQSTDRKHWATEFEVQASRNWRVKEPVYHYIKSLAPGEHLTDSDWADCIREDAMILGFDQYVAVLHTDRPHQHADIVVNAVLHDGRTWAQRQDRVKLRTAAQAQEVRYGLTRTRAVSDRPTIGKEEFERSARLHTSGQAHTPIPEKLMIAEAVSAAAAKASSLDEFAEMLTQQGIAVRTRMKEGHPVGISFAKDGQAFAGRSVGMPLKRILKRIYANRVTNPASTAPTVAEGISQGDRYSGQSRPHPLLREASYAARRSLHFIEQVGRSRPRRAAPGTPADPGPDPGHAIIDLALILSALAILFTESMQANRSRRPRHYRVPTISL